MREIMECERYPGISRILHWLVAALVFVTWPLGLMIGFVKNEVKLDFYMVHESLGFLLLWLMLLRIGAKLIAGSPAAEGSFVEHFAAATVHGLLYLFLVVMPVSGFLATNAHGFPLDWFGVLPIWSPIGKSPDVAGAFSTIHAWTGWILLGLFALHFGAVLMHHIIKRDHTLQRML